MIAQGVLLALRDCLLERRAVQTLLLKLGFDLLAASLDLAFGDDVAVHLGDDLFDHTDIRGQTYAYKRKYTRAHPKTHKTIIPQGEARG